MSMGASSRLNFSLYVMIFWDNKNNFSLLFIVWNADNAAAYLHSAENFYLW